MNYFIQKNSVIIINFPEILKKNYLILIEMNKLISSSRSSSSNSISSSSSSDTDGEHSNVSDFDQLHLEDTYEKSPSVSNDVTNVTSGDASVVVKGANKDYVQVKTYQSMIAAKDGIANREICDQLWTRGISYSTQQGDKICFTCKGNPRCPKRMQLLLDPESQDVHVSVSMDEHSHLSLCRRPQLNAQSRARVLELVASGVTKPRRILKILEEAKLPILSRVQINNLKQRILKKTSGPLTCSLSEFLQ